MSCLNRIIRKVLNEARVHANTFVTSGNIQDELSSVKTELNRTSIASSSHVEEEEEEEGTNGSYRLREF